MARVSISFVSLFQKVRSLPMLLLPLFSLSQHTQNDVNVCVCPYSVVVVVENGFSPLTCQTNNNTSIYQSTEGHKHFGKFVSR